MLILIVDDDATQREMLQGFLKKKGFEVLTAVGGAEALALFEKEPVQLVLLDNRMPDMTGDEVLEKMKALDPMVHVIMITAYGSIDTVIRTMKLGAVEFFEKPVDLTRLLARIREIEQQVSLDTDVGEMKDRIEQTQLP